MKLGINKFRKINTCIQLNITYRKLPNISPGLIKFRKPFLMGLYMGGGGLIYWGERVIFKQKLGVLGGGIELPCTSARTIFTDRNCTRKKNVCDSLRQNRDELSSVS